MPVNYASTSSSTIGRILTRAGLLWLPPRCALCGEAAPGLALDLCSYCHEALPRRPDAAVDGGAGLLLAPFAYAWPVDAMIRELKFRGTIVHARVLGTLLGQERAKVPWPLPEALVPVPLHPRRWRERGFNQACELARHAASVLGLPLETRCLERIVPTAEQSLLSGEARRRNVEGAFRARRLLRWRRVALVDDVLTTGSTVAAARRALHDAGALEVEVWVAARAGPDQARNVSSSRMPMKITSPT